jgi:hypothetical protein
VFWCAIEQAGYFTALPKIAFFMTKAIIIYLNKK